MTDPARVVAIVLAAGAGSRFGGGKLTAPLDGRPLVAHAVRTARSAGVGAIVLVTGAGADAVREVIEPLLGPRDLIAHNDDWASGLASSVRIGLVAADRALPGADAALMLLGDQPRVPLGAIAELLGAAPEPDRPIVAPRYPSDGGHNPVLLRRSGWALAGALAGDRGLGPLMAARPELVAWVAVEGQNPDVDTTDDLGRLEDGARP